MIASLIPTLVICLLTPDHPRPFDTSIETLRDFLNCDVGELTARPHHEAYRYVWEDYLKTVRNKRRPIPEDLDNPTMPILWQFRLSLTTETESWCIQSPKDLQGLVSIPSKDAAKEYLGCYSNIYVIRLFSQYHFVQIVEKDNPRNEFAHASFAELNAFTGHEFSVEVREDGNSFVLNRYLLEYDSRRSHTTLHAVVERLTRNGHYEMTILSSRPYGKVESLIRLPSVRLPK